VEIKQGCLTAKVAVGEDDRGATAEDTARGAGVCVCVCAYIPVGSCTAHGRRPVDVDTGDIGRDTIQEGGVQLGSPLEWEHLRDDDEGECAGPEREEEHR